MTSFNAKPAVGGGGPGPAGGGGGNPGSGDDKSAGERLQFVRLRTPVPDAAAAVVPAKPIIPPQPKVAPAQPQPQVTAAAPASPVTPATIGAGTGAGGKGAGGAGPGTGGGVGSGIGPGTGSNVGPGTGGGPAKNYLATPTQLFLPPLPAPASVKGYHMTAFFDVDEKGQAKLLGFNPSPDGGYNRKLREVLQSMRFRPGTRPDGTPIRDTVDVQFTFF